MGKVLYEETFSLLIKESIKLYNNNATEYTKYNWDGSVAAGAALVSHYCLSNIEYPNKRCTYLHDIYLLYIHTDIHTICLNAGEFENMWLFISIFSIHI